MPFGLDTSFIVPVEVREHPGHKACRAWLDRAIADGATFALAPQVLTEFLHVVTDPNRFDRPLTMDAACRRAEAWWNASEVRPIYPGPDSTRICLEWLRRHRLGRKRLLDTMLASTYYSGGISEILTADASGFAVFGVFKIVYPAHT